MISELYDGEASFLVSLPFGTRPAHDQAVLLDIKPCNLNRSQIDEEYDSITAAGKELLAAQGIDDTRFGDSAI